VATPLFGTGNSTTFSAASGTAATINKPANLADGDWLIWVAYSQSGGVTTTPSGWTQLFAIPTRTGAVYAKFIPTASAEVATSYSITFPGTGRMCMDMFLYRGGPTSGVLDVSGAFTTQAGTSPMTIASITTTAAADILFEFAYYNDSTTTQSVFTQDAAMTMGEQVSSPTTGNTSGILIAWQTLGAAGATGTRTFSTSPTGASNSGVLFALKAGASPVAANLALTGTVTATATVNHTADTTLALSSTATADSTRTNSGTVDSTLALTLAPTAAATITQLAASNLAITGTLTASTATPVAAWIAVRPMYIAHRNEELDWPEETLYGYQQARAWNSQQALEISVQQSSDGVWVCSHDQTTGRVFAGTSLDIPTNTWATLSSKVTINGGYPIARLVDIMDAFPTCILWVDNKATVNVSAFLDTLDAHGGNTRVIVKGYSGSTGYADSARARGYKTWGYFYHTDVSHLGTWDTHWDLLGMEIDAGTTSDWSTIKSIGKPVIAHTTIISLATKATATGFGADGYMASKAIDGTVPQTSNAAPLALGLSLTADTTVTRAGQATAALTATVTATAVKAQLVGTITALTVAQAAAATNTQLAATSTTVSLSPTTSALNTTFAQTTTPLTVTPIAAATVTQLANGNTGISAIGTSAALTTKLAQTTTPLTISAAAIATTTQAAQTTTTLTVTFAADATVTHAGSVSATTTLTLAITADTGRTTLGSTNTAIAANGTATASRTATTATTTAITIALTSDATITHATPPSANLTITFAMTAAATVTNNNQKDITVTIFTIPQRWVGKTVPQRYASTTPPQRWKGQ
jgi:hypothetical protein